MFHIWRDDDQVACCDRMDVIAEQEIPFAVKKERVEKLLEEGAKRKGEYMSRFVGRELSVVPETFSEGFTEGYSENYIRIYIPGDVRGRLVRVRAKELFRDGLKAEEI